MPFNERLNAVVYHRKVDCKHSTLYWHIIIVDTLCETLAVD